MDNHDYHDLPEQTLIALIQLDNNHPDKLQLINFINGLTVHQSLSSSLLLFVTKVIHLAATYQQDNLFWLTLSICEKIPQVKITEQKNAIGDKIIHTLMRSSALSSLNLLEGLLSYESTLGGQLNDFQETPLHVFLNTLAFNPLYRENLLQQQETRLFRFLEILSEAYLLKDALSSNLARLNKKGLSPLHLCAFYGLENELDYFLKQHPELVDFPTSKKTTCLIIAAKRGHAGIVDILLKYKANLEIKTQKKQNSALHIAAQKGHRLVCEKLIPYGLTSLKNARHFTSLDLAKQNHRHDCYELLLEHENEQALLNYRQNFTPIYTESGNRDKDIPPVFSDNELTLNTFLMGITLGYELAYQKIPEGKLISIKNELNQTQLYTARQLYHSSGLISYILMPYNPNVDELIEIYVTFQGTNDIDALHRDLEDKGPGYQSYKQKESDLIAKFFEVLSPFFQTYTNKLSITLAGHSLGGGDCFYFLQSLLKIVAQHSAISYDKTLFTQQLMSDKISNTTNINNEVIEIINQTEKLILEKPLVKSLTNLNNITRARVITLNPVGLPKSTDHALEGLSRYLNKKLKIESFVLRSEGDFAQRMSDRVPLCDIPAEYAKVNLLLAPGDSFAVQKASACYLGAASLNPHNTSTNFVNIGTDMAMLGTFGGLALGPFGLLMGLAAGGVRLYTSDKLKQWGKQMALNPHSNLLPQNANQDLTLLKKIKLIANTNPEFCAQIREIGHNLNTTTFERFVTQTSKQQLGENLKYSYF